MPLPLPLLLPLLLLTEPWLRLHFPRAPLPPRMDAAEPSPICEEGSYCKDAGGGKLVCERNAPGCGASVGAPCCVVSTPSTTNYECGGAPGLYCPFGSEDEPRCRACLVAGNAEASLPWECSRADGSGSG